MLLDTTARVSHYYQTMAQRQDRLKGFIMAEYRKSILHSFDVQQPANTPIIFSECAATQFLGTTIHPWPIMIANSAGWVWTQAHINLRLDYTASGRLVTCHRIGSCQQHHSTWRKKKWLKTANKEYFLLFHGLWLSGWYLSIWKHKTRIEALLHVSTNGGFLWWKVKRTVWNGNPELGFSLPISVSWNIRWPPFRTHTTCPKTVGTSPAAWSHRGPGIIGKLAQLWTGFDC